MAVNSKNKGNTYERSVSKTLSKRFEDRLGIEVGFRRATDSGSYFGGTNAVRMETHDLDYATYGDIVCPREFNFTLECKAYKAPPSFDLILKQDVKLWDEWIQQADDDAKKDGKKPFIVVKYNRTTEFAMLDSSDDYGLVPAMKYKAKNIYKFSDVLSLPDDVFFN